MSRMVIEQIKDRLPIAEVLAGYITLIPAGSAFKARCPFHNEKTPSFNISPANGFYYCFGCGEKGDIFSFVQKFEGLDFKGALRVLADKAGVPLVYEEYSKADEGKDAYAFLDALTTRYQMQLQNNTAATAYLTGRGVTQETIAAFRIGYAPEEWQFVAGTLSKEDKSIAEEMGLVKSIEKDGQSRLYDRFRSRILFPMNDSSGRVIAYSGRIFPASDSGPKYLNSPETSLFHKSKVLYGFDKAKGPIKKHNFAILVEGQMDMVLSHQYGFRNTVATSGTAVSAEAAKDPFSHIAIISRLTPNIVLAFDGDEAGIKAQQRAALVAYSLGMNPKVLSLPEGMDPADYLHAHGADAWKELLKNSKTYIQVALDRIPQSASAAAIPRLLQGEIFPALALVRSNIEQSQYIALIAKELSLKENAVQSDFENFLKNIKEEAVVEVARTAKVALPDTFAQFKALSIFAQDEEISALYENAMQISFEDRTIALPEISDGDLEYATLYIEREYGHLEMKDLRLLAQELHKKLSHNFLEAIKQEYNALLKKQQFTADMGEDRIMRTLHAITKRQHET